MPAQKLPFSDDFLRALEREAARLNLAPEVMAAGLAGGDSPPQRFFDCAPDPMMIIDTRGQIIAHNAAYQELTGCGPEGLTRRAHRAFVHPDDQIVLMSVLERLSDGLDVPPFAVRMRSGGRFLWLEWHVRLQDGLYYCTGRDISHQRELEQKLASSATIQRQTEVDLRRRTQEFLAVVENNPDPVARFNADLRHTFVNQANADMTGVCVEQMIGRTMAELNAPPQMIERLETALRAVFETGRPQQVNFDFTGPSGRKYFDARIAPEYNDSGGIEAALVVGHDITAQRELEVQLRESETWYRGIVESQVDLVSRHLPDSTIVFVNDAYCRYYGLTREELIGQSFLITEPPEVHEELLAKLQRTINATGPHIEENLTYHRDGSPRWVQWMSYGFADENGNVTMIQSVGRDITQQKLTEQVRHENETRFHAMLQAVSEGIALIDAQNRPVIVNRYIEERFGHSHAELTGDTIFRLFDPSSHAAVEEKLTEARATRENVRMSHPLPRAITATGRHFPVEITFVPLVLSDQPMIMCLLMDVTERLELEEQRIINRALEVELEKERELIDLKQRLTTLITHEFRTPLTVIQSTVDIIKTYIDRLPPEKLAERLDIISKQARRMGELLTDVLMYSRGEHGLTAQLLEPVDLAEFCRDMIEDLRLADGGEHPITLSIASPDLLLHTDRRLLEHICLNLIGNAIKYSPSGGAVDVWLGREAAFYTLKVTDHGIGIPEADMGRIYDPFHRAANVGTRSGSGLGLPIVKQCVEALGGTITTHSQIGLGTTFMVSIPERAASD